MSREWKRCQFLCELRDIEIGGTSKVIGYICKGPCQGCQAHRHAEDALKAKNEELAGYVKRFRETLAEVAQMAINSDQEQIFEKCRDALRDVYLEEKFRDAFDKYCIIPTRRKGERMIRCPKCGSGLIVQLLVYRSDGNTKYDCQECGYAWLVPVERQTVFHQITASPEVLAEKLVYRYDGNGTWRSFLLYGYEFLTKEESIAATVAKLKKVEK